MTNLANMNQTKTMTSLEVVELINLVRKEEGNNTVLAHSDFLKKVPEVIGETVAGNFSSYYTASNGKQNPCYTFPKRESMLMAMSYSYTTQARLYDRWEALEAKQAVQIPQTYAEALLEAGRLATENEKLSLENKEVRLERNATLATVNKLGDVLLYQARVLEAREEDLQELKQIYRRRK